MERVREPARARADRQAGTRRGEWHEGWRGRAGAAATVAGLGLALGTETGWLQLAGVFLTTLGVHFWVMSRQQDG